MVSLVKRRIPEIFPISSVPLVGLIHGDMAQFDRTQVITEFKKRDMPILIATDVAGLFFDDFSSFEKRRFVWNI